MPSSTFFCCLKAMNIRFLLTITTLHIIHAVCNSQSMLIRDSYDLLVVITYSTCHQIVEWMGVNKIGFDKNQRRRKKKSLIRVIFTSLMVVVLYRFCFLSLSLSPFFHTPIMLCSLLYSTTMTSWRNKSRPKENKSELKRRLNKQIHAYIMHIHERWERILNTIVRERVIENMHLIVKKKMKKQKLKKEIKCLCVCNPHSLALFVHDDRKEREVQWPWNQFIQFSLLLFSACVSVYYHEKEKEKEGTQLVEWLE